MPDNKPVSRFESVKKFDDSINAIRQQETTHRKAMKKLLGNDYQSPAEQYERFKNNLK